MSDLLPLPASYAELRELPMRRKGEWHGAGWLMAVLVWLGYCGPLALAFVLSFWHPAWAVLALANIGTVYIARVFMLEYHTVRFGVTWASSDTKDLDQVQRNSGPHESVHDWHQQHVQFYELKYICPHPHWRRHFEAAAYALDVVNRRRTLDEAVNSFRGWIYFQFMGEAEARALINRYVLKWSAHVRDLPRLRTG